MRFRPDIKDSVVSMSNRESLLMLILRLISFWAVQLISLQLQ